MATETLVDSKIRAGEIFVKKLSSENFKFDAAMWFYFSEIQEWKLILAIPKVKVFGPRKSYLDLQKYLSETDFYGVEKIDLEDVSVIDSNDKLINILGMMVRTGPDDIAGIRASNNYINGVLIEDAYIYRLSKSA